MQRLTSLRLSVALFIIVTIILITLLASAQGGQTATADQLYQQAINLYYQGEFKESLDLMRTVVRDNPLNDAMRFDLTYLLREAGHFAEALKHLTLLVRWYPNEETYHNALLTTAYLAGDHDLVLTTEGSFASAEAYFWKGLSAYELKDYARARNFLTQTISLASFNPLAHYFLGLINLAEADFSAAKTNLTKALTQDPNLFAARYDLARAYLGLGDHQAAYNRLRQAESVAPGNDKIKTDLTNLLAAHPELQTKEKEAAKVNRQVAAAPSAVPLAGKSGEMTTIRVGLADQVDTLWTKTGGTFRLATASGSKVITGKAQTILKFVYTPKRQIQVYDEWEKLCLETSESVQLSYEDPSATTLLFQMEYGRGYFWAGQENRAYRGTIQLIPFAAGMTIVNQVSMEEYLYAVVPSEMPSSWPAAALEAQAIAARTYAFSHLGSYEKRGFDLMGSVASQAYNGVKSENAAVRQAVDKTRGQILTHNGKPISAFYSANSGGYSAVPPVTWNFRPPYLQTVPDKLVKAHDGYLTPAKLAAWVQERLPSYSASKYSARSAYRWQVIVPRTEIEHRLKKQTALGEITGLVTAGREACGRVNHVLIQGTKGQLTISGDAIRSSLGGLRSNLFTVEAKLGADGLPTFFIFTGAGFGHGVGMDQSGAAGMADAGYSTEEILSHYYPGATLTDLY